MGETKFDQGKIVYDGGGRCFEYSHEYDCRHYGFQVFEIDGGEEIFDHTDEVLSRITEPQLKPPVEKLAAEVKAIRADRTVARQELQAATQDVRNAKRELQKILDEIERTKSVLQGAKNDKIPFVSELMELIDGTPMWIVENLDADFGPTVFCTSDDDRNNRVSLLNFEMRGDGTFKFIVKRGSDKSNYVDLYRSKDEATIAVQTHFNKRMETWERHGCEITGDFNGKPHCIPLRWINRCNLLEMPDALKEAVQKYHEDRKAKKIAETQAKLDALIGGTET